MKRNKLAVIIAMILICALAASGCGRQETGSASAEAVSEGVSAAPEAVSEGVSASSEIVSEDAVTASSAAEEDAGADEASAGTQETSGEEAARSGGEEDVITGSAETEDQDVPAAEPIEAEEVTEYSFSLGFAGDICFADNYIPMQYLAEIGSEDISDGIDPAYISLMNGMDLMWINNEFVYSDRGEALPGKAWTFLSRPENASYLKDLGVDIVGLANNHCYDYGEEAFLDTMATLEDEGIPYVGAGRNISEAASPVYLETNGFRIAYVAASNAEYTIYTPEATEDAPGILWCYEYDRFLDSIREAAENADYVIALPHWGMEHTTELTQIQIDGAHMCIDAGADAVIGTHPHVLQGLEYYSGKPILYSLGNFWFDGYDIDTAVAELRFRGQRHPGEEMSLEDAEVEVILHPGTQSGVYTALAGTQEWRRAIFDHLESVSFNVYIDDEGVVRPF